MLTPNETLQSERAPLTRYRVMKLAVPVIIAQAAIATTGVVDTLIMGLYGDKFDLAAVAVASVVFSFLYWGFGFLRMSTTGLAAQAVGRSDQRTATLVLQRAMLVGLLSGCLILLLSTGMGAVVFMPFNIDPTVERLSQSYFYARIWGGPALLMQYAITGWLLGTGRTARLLYLQLVMNGANIFFDAWFVIGLGWGPAGIGAGTALAEWSATLLGLWFVRHAVLPQKGLFERRALFEMFGVSRDILIRTLALLFGFAWFVRAGAQQGTTYLAANEVLLQFITVAAFVLDGFAFVAEKEIGQAYGSGQRQRFIRAIRISTELAISFALLISLIYFLLGQRIILAAITDQDVRQAALAYLPFCALVPLVGVAAYQLDGIFLGATQGRALRLAAIVSTLAYIGLDLLLRPLFGNMGVWLAFIGMYIFRAVALGWFLPGTLRSVGASSDPRQSLQQQS